MRYFTLGGRTGYRPEYPLDKGVKEIIAWYKKEGWL